MDQKSTFFMIFLETIRHDSRIDSLYLAGKGLEKSHIL